MKVRYGLIIIFILTSIALWIGYQAYLNDPKMKVIELAESIKNKDKVSFQKLVNYEILVHNLYKVNQKKYNSSEDDDVGSKIENFFNKTLSSLKEQSVKDELHTLVEMHFDSKIDQLTVVSSNLFSVIKNFDYDSIKSIKVQKVNEHTQAIRFSIFHKTYKHDFVINSVWEKQGSQWKLVNIANIAEIIAMYNRLENRRKNLAIHEKTQIMFRNLQIQSYEGTTKDIWILNYFQVQRTKHKFKVQNLAREGIISYEIKLSYRDPQDFVIIEMKQKFDTPLNVYEEAEVEFWSYNPIVHNQMRFGNNPDISIVSIQYESGEKDINPENMETRFFE